MRQRQFQNGSLRILGRKRGPSVWQFRYRVTGPDGRRVFRSVIAGTTADYPTVGSIRAKIRGLVLSINAEAVPRGEATVGQLIDRFIVEEGLARIVAGALGGPDALHYSTACGYLVVLNRYLMPRWGATALCSVRPAAVQEWLKSLQLAPKTKAHIRGVLRRLFEKAMLWEMVDLARNPIDLVEVKGVSRRRRIPTVLTPAAFKAVMAELPEPYRTMAMVAGCTGLRISEILALKWSDFDFPGGDFTVTRGVVRGRVSQAKTEYSVDRLPLDPVLERVLLAWRERAVANSEDWVFASPSTLRPFYSTAGEVYFKRASRDLGLRIGWHTFRHSYRSWLDATGAPVGVQQKLMRHAQISTTKHLRKRAHGLEARREPQSGPPAHG
jgi:integrase